MFDIITALVTPFKEDNRIDYLSIHRLMDYLIKEGNTHFVLCGTTGECSCLSMKEKIEYIHYMIQHFKQCRFIVGISSNCTKEAIYQMEQLSIIEKIEAWLVVTPYYNKPNQEGLFQHFDAIAKASDKNIILYNVPSRTSVTLQTNTIINLVKNNDNIIGLKEAGDIKDAVLLKEQLPGFCVYLGSDELLEAAIMMELDGVISVASHLLYKTMEDAARKEAIDYFDYKLKVNYLFKDSSPAPIKYLLSQKKLIQNYLRLPLVPVSNEMSAQLNRVFRSN
ncbi:4-hydroxy-tetrahydrodipicolinate synthase [Tannockella kyphosi]|uniref:4-hydroxy-tetrahydrodipicolinate synthase n=1 Tax=Tannockella kyphosi TaxID=2899121 RepID=UPI0020130282|nr:4-hydroxy-tetrahydrodipicolinate synthase [Tannockella kyphosi]